MQNPAISTNRTADGIKYPDLYPITMEVVVSTTAVTAPTSVRDRLDELGIRYFDENAAEHKRRHLEIAYRAAYWTLLAGFFALLATAITCGVTGTWGPLLAYGLAIVGFAGLAVGLYGVYAYFDQLEWQEVSLTNYPRRLPPPMQDLADQLTLDHHWVSVEYAMIDPLLFIYDTDHQTRLYVGHWFGRRRWVFFNGAA